MLYWIGIPLGAIFCAPEAGKAWEISSIYKKYQRFTLFVVVQGVMAVVLDLYIFFLPIPIILTLKLSAKRRLLILGVFGTAML